MRLPTREQLRYHGSRWAWVAGLALLAYIVFPSSATNVAPLLEPGAVADRDVIAPFSFPLNNSFQYLSRQSQVLPRTVNPIYQYQARPLDTAKIAMHAFFSSV